MVKGLGSSWGSVWAAVEAQGHFGFFNECDDDAFHYHRQLQITLVPCTIPLTLGSGRPSPLEALNTTTKQTLNPPGLDSAGSTWRALCISPVRFGVYSKGSGFGVQISVGQLAIISCIYIYIYMLTSPPRTNLAMFQNSKILKFQNSKIPTF